MYCFIVLLHLFSSSLQIRSLLFPWAYVSIESIDCIILSSFELKAILIISSVKTLFFSLLNLCCVFRVILIFFMNSFWSSLILSTSILFFSKWFILFSYSRKQPQSLQLILWICSVRWSARFDNEVDVNLVLSINFTLQDFHYHLHQFL